MTLARQRASSEGGGAGTATKGRATPTRRDAEAARRTSVIGGTGAGATGKGGRGSRADSVSRREAMRRGDPSALSTRDRGPVRAFVRDYVDSRRNVIGAFIYVGIPSIALAYSHVSLLTLLGLGLLYAFVVAAIIDFVLMVRGLGRQLAIRFPDQPRKGLGKYAMLRAMQLRRSRIPSPRVQRGAPLL
jgi:hypothetical protein